MGEEIEVVAPEGMLLRVRIDEITPTRVAGMILDEWPHRPEPRSRISIAVANLPAPALELVLSRCTEAGAHSFMVFQADRSVARGAKPERWRVICREAAMLAGRLRVPEVAAASSLDAALASVESPVLLVRGSTTPLARITEPADLTLFIGPEGGWTERELALVPLHAGLGPRNLRADTAALVGLAIAVSVRE